MQVEIKVDKEFFYDVPDILLQDIWDQKRVKGLLIGEQEAFLPVDPDNIAVPITETFRDRSIGTLKGRISEFL